MRTTFKLSERSIEALSILAGQLGIKQKSLFDHLIEDTQALQLIAEEVDEFTSRMQRTAKTYVVSRKTLETLEKVSMQYDVPRDALAEYSIARILPLLIREKEKHAKRKLLLKELHAYLQKGSELVGQAESDFGRDDPISLEMFNMLRIIKHCCEDLKHSVEKGKKIENF